MINSEQPIYLLWLLILVIMSWVLPNRWIGSLMALSCALFLAIYSPWSLLVLALTTLFTGLAIQHEKHYSWSIPIVITVCLSSLLLYRALNQNTDFLDNITLLGMAFYMLRVTHLLFECYAGRQQKARWSHLISWLWFLPTLQVGPIHRFRPFQQDLLRRRWDSNLFASGLELLVFGFFKVIVLGNYLITVKYNQWLLQFPVESWWYHYLESLRYGLHLYFKFSGYSDIAIGFASLLGFRIAENFNFPFLATNISDFWRRWHISLSSWCRDYVYLPVIAYSRKPALAAITSMLVLGAWHELSTQYFLWGIWHGTGIAIYQTWSKTNLQSVLNSGWISRIWIPIAGVITSNFVILSFTLTSTETFAESIDRWRVLLGIGL
tara:strand:+ start:825 stop:1961 length:1137 start_codon:yes stop_codon:yes gene_type:complete